MLMIYLTLAILRPDAVGQHLRKPADRPVQVDAQGVLRWEDDGAEVALFGVNYYTPCSIDYASLRALGLNHKETIDHDLLHFERMGLDALRLHVFDREISDERGNLIENEHLELLDYLIAEAKKRGIYTILTPIAWWYASPGTHGFSDLYDKAQMHTHPEAVAAQCNYLRQFVSHVNRYTGLAYAEDPAVPCFEIINEPIPAPNTPDDVVITYINTLYDAIRSTGTRKPIFYNGWGGRHAAVAEAKVEGCSFGWYPSGLASGGMLTRNFLPAVNDYPDMRDEVLNGKAKIVYEFDAADIPGGYIYPAIARAFRSGGAQIATQFQYDPLPLADTNVNWQTHFLNLVYAPSRAVSFAIAAEAFRRLPRLGQYGVYPESCRFGEFRVSYEEQLSEMVDDETFMYSNDTKTNPPTVSKLKRIVGCGSSPVVKYEGTGAYFLDRLAKGLWRLEVYPDCVWVADPFGSTSLQREVSRVYWRARRMAILLPDLGPRFVAERLLEPLESAQARNGAVVVSPGVYLLRRAGVPKPAGEFDVRFYAPPQRDLPPTVWHIPAKAGLEGQPLTVTCNVACALDPEQVVLHVHAPDGRLRSVSMHLAGPYRFETTIPSELAQKGILDYCITLASGGRELTFPEPEEGSREERFAEREPAVLLDCERLGVLPPVTVGGAPGEQAKAELSESTGVKVLRMTATGFGPPPSAAGLRLPVLPPGEALRGLNTLVVLARKIAEQTSHLEVALIGADDNQSAFGYDVPLESDFAEFRVPLKRLRPLWQTTGGRCQPEEVREIQLTFGSWLFPNAAKQAHGLEVRRIWLEYEPRLWHVPIHGAEDPVVLFAPKEPLPGIITELPYRQWIAPGSRPDTTCWHIEVERFGPPPNCLSVRADVSELVAVRKSTLVEHDTLRIRARAASLHTTAVEVVLTEDDGSPWGFTPHLTQEWQDIVVPLTELQYFSHWSHPENRGGPGDHCRPESLSGVHITFGAWLYPGSYDQQHGLEIEFIRLER